MTSSLPRIALPLLRPEDVIPHLGKGELHWQQGFSAKAVAESWFKANDLPEKVRQVLEQAPEFHGAELVDAWLERCTALPWGRGRASQTDLLAVLGIQDEVAVLGVEAKVKESFGPLVFEWLAEGGENRRARLAGLCGMFGVDPSSARDLRYQLFHRTAAAILETKRYRASKAVLLDHSFCPEATGLTDFTTFFERVGFPGVGRDKLSGPRLFDGVSLWIGWASDECPQ